MEFFSFQSGQTEDESGWGDDSDSDEEERQQTSHGGSYPFSMSARRFPAALPLSSRPDGR